MAYYAASIDDAETNKKFAESLGADYPILSDPTKQTAKSYGVLDGGGDYAHRVTLYIGKDGKILKVDASIHPSTAGDDTIRILRSLGFSEQAKKSR